MSPAANNLEAILTALRAIACEFSVKDGRFLVKRVSAMPPELRELVTKHRFDLVNYLKRLDAEESLSETNLEQRLQKGAELLSEMEERGETDTEDYHRRYRLWFNILCRYEQTMKGRMVQLEQGALV